jgi:hypothetical protein
MTTQLHPPERGFVQRFAPTRRGVRLARRLAVHQLDVWGVPLGSPLSEAAALVVSELASNAMRHGHVPGRDFLVELAAPGEVAALRIEVSDARAGMGPASDGYGLALVTALAVAWGVSPRDVGKTVWAEVADG